MILKWFIGRGVEWSIKICKARKALHQKSFWLGSSHSDLLKLGISHTNLVKLTIFYKGSGSSDFWLFLKKAHDRFLKQGARRLSKGRFLLFYTPIEGSMAKLSKQWDCNPVVQALIIVLATTCNCWDCICLGPNNWFVS